MQPGKILYAEHQGTYVLKLIGDVRLTLCAALDGFLERMFSHPKFTSVLIDLTATEGIDSTTLGVLAKLAIQAKKRYNQTPVLYSTHADITRILVSMGFDDVFDIRDVVSDELPDLGELPLSEQTPEQMYEKVLEAHRTLVGLNAENELRFHELIESLEASKF